MPKGLQRREFITLLGSAAAAWPLSARAQQGEQMRRVGVLMHSTADEPESQTRIAVLQQGLQEAGWTIGRNVQVNVRWSGGDIARLRQDAAELVALAPDVIVGGTGQTAPVLHRATRTVPVVLAQVIDPVGGGYVASLARPGGNITGFTQFEYSLTGKWFELLKEVAPHVARIGVVRDMEGLALAAGQWAVIQAFAAPRGIELIPINVRFSGDTERDLSEFARAPNSGLIVGVSAPATVQKQLIIALAARHKLPTMYPYRFFVDAGGLISYGPNLINLYRRAAGYVDRILKGEKPAHLPVQAPTKYELAINLKTAKALGLTMPPSVLVRADEVIE
jgi:putative ABC transport system substrate-binding protein